MTDYDLADYKFSHSDGNGRTGNYPCSATLFKRIVVLENGTIVDDSTHAELSRAGGTYESLWDRQAGAFLEAE